MTLPRKWTAIALAVLSMGTVSPVGHAQPSDPAPVIEPVVLGEMPHDATAFTEGFEIDGPVLYEGTGQVGESQLRELDPVNGKVLRAVDVPGDYFAEGITVVGDRVW